MPESFVQVPPDSTGSKLRHRSRVIGGNTVLEQAVFQGALPTYYCLADAVAFATNKQLISLMNESGSGVVLELRKLLLIDLAVVAVTGVALRADFKRITAHSGGTLITPQSADSTNAALPAQITPRTGATAATEGAILYPVTFNNDEVGATQAFPTAWLQATISPTIDGPEIQGLRLREGEGVTLKQITTSVIGSYAYLLVFTVDA